MTSVPPPQGMGEHEYETIEAAVTETVRGRWFLNEFARRNRTAELRQLLDAMGRLEGAVLAGQQALPPADPSIRLLMQRIKEVAAQLDGLSSEMRVAGLEPRFVEAVEHQAKAVSGMMRGGSVRPALPNAGGGVLAPVSTPVAPRPEQPAASVRPELAALVARMPRADLPPALSRASSNVDAPADDPRLAALSTLDGLSLAKKLALFS